MIGFIRLALAFMVALSHAGVAIGGRHIGVPAVVVFYVLAGYIVALQFSVISRGRSRPAAVAAFWRDRALRLFPIYLAVLAFMAAVAIAVDPESYFLSRDFGAACAAGNLFVVPMNFFAFNGFDQCALIPVSWSLGLEMQFYLLFPLLALLRPGAMWAAGAASVGVYIVALAGVIDSDIWGYRLLPGTLFMFLMGVLLGQAHLAGDRRREVMALATAPAALCGLALISSTPQAGVFFTIETLVGLAAAVPLILIGRSVPRSRLDDYAGLAAYPLFLMHFGFIWIFRAFDPESLAGPAGLFAYLAATAAGALALALVIDRPIGDWRRRRRNMARRTQC